MHVIVVYRTDPNPENPEIELVQLYVDEKYKNYTMSQWREEFPSVVGIQWVEEDAAARLTTSDYMEIPVEPIDDGPQLNLFGE